MSSIYRGDFCPSKQRGPRQRSGAEHQPRVDRDDEVGVFSSSLTYLQGLFCFLKLHLNTINATLSILGIYHE